MTPRSLAVLLCFHLLGGAFAINRQIDLIAQPIAPTLTNGWAVHMTAAGNLVLVAGASDLWTVDVSEATPKLLGGCRLSSGLATHASTDGRYAYVAAQDPGIFIVDLADPAKPRQVATLNTPGTAYRSLVVSNLLYVTDGDALQVVDISDPVKPKAGARLPLSGVVWDMAINGTYAYLTGGTNLHVVDISSPADPSFMNSIPITSVGRADDIELSEGLAYVALNEGGLAILDLANPVTPTVRSRSHEKFNLVSVQVWDRFAFLSSRHTGLVVLDVSDPTAPTLAGGFIPVNNAQATGLAMIGNRAFLAGGDRLGGFVALQAQLALPALSQTPGSVRLGDTFIAVRGSNLLASRFSMIVEVDFASNPAQVIKTNIPNLPPERAIVIDSNFAAIVGATSFTTLRRTADDEFELGGVIPFVSFISTYPTRNTIAIHKSHILLANESQGFSIIDVSDLAAPRVALTLTNMSRPNSLAHEGNLAAVVAGAVELIDVTDPRAPRLLGQVPGINSATAIALENKHLFVARYSRVDTQVRSDLMIFDLSNPESPTLLGSAPLRTSPFRMVQEGTWLAAAHGRNGFEIFDVSDPREPRRVGGNSAVVSANALLAGDRLYIGGDGVSVFQLPSPLISPAFGPLIFDAASGDLILKATAKPGTLQILASPDLLDWQPLPTLESASGQFELRTPATSERKFFRALSD